MVRRISAAGTSSQGSAAGPSIRWARPAAAEHGRAGTRPRRTRHPHEIRLSECRGLDIEAGQPDRSSRQEQETDRPPQPSTCRAPGVARTPAQSRTKSHRPVIELAPNSELAPVSGNTAVQQSRPRHADERAAVENSPASKNHAAYPQNMLASVNKLGSRYMPRRKRRCSWSWRRSTLIMGAILPFRLRPASDHALGGPHLSPAFT